jgi:hypothetical protein
MSTTYGGVGEIKNSDDKRGRSALLAGLGAVSALLVVIAFAASHLTTSQVKSLFTWHHSADLMLLFPTSL